MPVKYSEAPNTAQHVVDMWNDQEAKLRKAHQLLGNDAQHLSAPRFYKENFPLYIQRLDALASQARELLEAFKQRQRETPCPTCNRPLGDLELK